MIKQKTMFFVFLLTILFVQFGCVSEMQNDINSETKNIDFYYDVKRDTESSIEFLMYNYSDVNSRNYTLIYNGIVKEEKQEIYTNSVLLNSLEPGDYSVIFEYRLQNGEVIKSRSYNFNVEELTEEVDINNLEIIRTEENRINLVMYLKNNKNMELYLTEMDLTFQDRNGNDITDEFTKAHTFIPVLLRRSEEKSINIEYEYSSRIENLYVEVVVNGKTEGVMEPIRFTSKRQLARVIDKSEIQILSEKYKDVYLEGENISVDIEILGINKGEVVIFYGNQVIKRDFLENQTMQVEFTAVKDDEQIDFKIENLNIENNVQFSVKTMNDIEMDYDISNEIYANTDFEFELQIPDYLDEDLVEIYFSNNIELIDRNNFKYTLNAENTDEGYIKIKYDGIEVQEIGVQASINEKIKIDSKKYYEEDDKIFIEGDIYITDEYLYRFIELDINTGYELESINTEDIELLTQERGKVKIKIELTKNTSNNLKLFIKYKQVETLESIIIKIF